MCEDPTKTSEKVLKNCLNYDKCKTIIMWKMGVCAWVCWAIWYIDIFSERTQTYGSNSVVCG